MNLVKSNRHQITQIVKANGVKGKKNGQLDVKNRPFAAGNIERSGFSTGQAYRIGAKLFLRQGGLKASSTTAENPMTHSQVPSGAPAQREN